MSNYISYTCTVCNDSFDSLPTKLCGKNGVKCDIIERYKIAQQGRRSYPQFYCGLAGAKEAGKTYFLLSLLSNLLDPPHELENLLNELQLSFEFHSNSSKEEFAKLVSNATKSPLGGTIVPSELTAQPFDLLIHKNKKSAKQNYILTIFNSSGELYDKPSETKISLRHEVKDANVMLTFIDPIHDKGFSDLLNENDIAKNPYDINSIKILYEVLKKNSEKVSVPMAVCLSKFDLLHHHQGLPIHQPYITLGDIQQVLLEGEFEVMESTSNQLKNLLQKYSSTTKPNEIDRKFNNTKYFAVAPIGHNEINTAKKLEPKGIYAPFFWVLQQLRII